MTASASPRPRPRRDRGVRRTLPAALLALAVGLVLGAAGSGAAHAAHPHYLRLLRQGTFALERGEPDAAVRDLRLACFGFLDEPPLLAQCLVRLGLAQAGAGDDEGFRETFRRVVEVEERFGAYAAADVSPEERDAFETQIAARIPARTLEYSSVFKRLAQTPETAAATGSVAAATDEGPGERAGAPPPASGRERRSTGTGGSAADTARTDAAPGTAGRTTPGAAELSPEDRSDLDRARRLLAAAVRRSDLDQPLALARRIADAYPGSREAQHLAAVIAYRASRWQEAVHYFRRGGDPGEDNAESLFYYAVSLYESGDREAAADALRRSLPHLEATPFVERYRDRILGSGGDAGPSGSAGIQ